MSTELTQSITCPECGAEGRFSVWQSINTGVNPEMYDKVRDGSAFLYTCPKCGCRAAVEYDCLYHQPQDRLMIQRAGMGKSDSFVELMSKLSEPLPEYTFRIVANSHELREKLAIFDAGLDDRVIEIIKLIFLVQMEQQNPDIKPDEVLMYNNAEGQHMLAFFEKGVPMSEAEITDDIYAGIRVKIGQILKDTDHDMIIDQDWAFRHIGP